MLCSKRHITFWNMLLQENNQLHGDPASSLHLVGDLLYRNRTRESWFNTFLCLNLHTVHSIVCFFESTALMWRKHDLHLRNPTMHCSSLRENPRTEVPFQKRFKVETDRTIQETCEEHFYIWVDVIFLTRDSPPHLFSYCMFLWFFKIHCHFFTWLIYSHMISWFVFDFFPMICLFLQDSFITCFLSTWFISYPATRLIFHVMFFTGFKTHFSHIISFTRVISFHMILFFLHVIFFHLFSQFIFHVISLPYFLHIHFFPTWFIHPFKWFTCFQTIHFLICDSLTWFISFHVIIRIVLHLLWVIYLYRLIDFTWFHG